MKNLKVKLSNSIFAYVQKVLFLQQQIREHAVKESEGGVLCPILEENT